MSIYLTSAASDYLAEPVIYIDGGITPHGIPDLASYTLIGNWQRYAPALTQAIRHCQVNAFSTKYGKSLASKP